MRKLGSWLIAVVLVLRAVALLAPIAGAFVLVTALVAGGVEDLRWRIVIGVGVPRALRSAARAGARGLAARSDAHPRRAMASRRGAARGAADGGRLVPSARGAAPRHAAVRVASLRRRAPAAASRRVRARPLR